MTDGQAASKNKGDAANAIGSFLRTHGWKPDNSRYRNTRRRLTHEINTGFGIRKTDDITTSEQAEKYLAYVRAYLARLNDEGWQ